MSVAAVDCHTGVGEERGEGKRQPASKFNKKLSNSNDCTPVTSAHLCTFLHIFLMYSAHDNLFHKIYYIRSSLTS